MSNSTVSAPAGLQRAAIGPTFGSAYVGALVTMGLYGLTTLQTWFYYINYPKDTRVTKGLVSVIWILDTVHVVLVGRVVYHYLVSEFGNVAALAYGNWELYLSIGINVLIALLVQTFFIFRIWDLSGKRTKWWLPALCTVATLLHFAFGEATVVKFALINEFSRLHEIFDNLVTPFAVTAVLSDVFIAGALCTLLWGERTDFKDTNNLLAMLIVWAINRCLLTSLVAIAEVIVFALRPDDFWFIAIDFVIGKLYANSLLATLNARRAMRSRSSHSSSRGTSVSTSFQIATTVSGGAQQRSRVRSLPNTRPVHSAETPRDSCALQTFQSRTTDTSQDVERGIDIELQDAPSLRHEK